MEFKTEEEILLSMIAKAQEENLISNTDDIVERVGDGDLTENQYVLDLATHAYILSDLTDSLSDFYDGVDIATARGIQLDRLGHLVNVPRLPGIPAMLVLELSLELAENTEIVIPAGTVVEIDQLQVDPYITYTTDEEVTIPAGVTTASVTASSDVHALQRRVPMECVKGLKGFPLVHVYNREAGTSGRTIENDDDYRQRILLWNVINTKGTKASFEAYLGQVDGLDDYRLIPRPEGDVGTLTVVCDCPEAILTDIQAGIQDNCMLFTDDPVDAVNPTSTYLDVEVSCMITREPIQHTVSEIVELIQREVETFIDGGNMRNGSSYFGLHIGESFIPSQLVMQLHNMFPELVSISCDTVETSVDDYHKLRCGEVTVVIT